MSAAVRTTVRTRLTRGLVATGVAATLALTGTAVLHPAAAATSATVTRATAASSATAATARASSLVTVRSPAATALGYALAMLGTPYVWGGSSPTAGFDCSGLVMRAYGFAGYPIPRTSAAQYTKIPHLRFANRQPGDLVFWGTDPTDVTSVYHVAIYAGAGMVVSAPSTGDVVRLKPIGARNLMPYVVRPAGTARGFLPVQVGTAGWGVQNLQHRLRNNGLPVTVTGRYDPATMVAVRRLQRGLGYAANGYVGGQTWSYLVTHGNVTSVS